MCGGRERTFGGGARRTDQRLGCDIACAHPPWPPLCKGDRGRDVVIRVECHCTVCARIDTSPFATAGTYCNIKDPFAERRATMGWSGRATPRWLKDPGSTFLSRMLCAMIARNALPSTAHSSAWEHSSCDELFHPARWWKIILGGLAGAAIVSASPWVSRGSQQAAQGPLGEKFWPSEFGADDQRGAANRITPAKVAGAARLVKRGQIYQLGRLYEHGMPIPGKRHFSLTIPGLPTGLPTGSNNIVSNDELVSGEIGQVGTQFDGLGHVGVRIDKEDYFYNGNKLSEFGDPYGLKKLGVENAGVFFTRGILLDLCALQGKDRLPAGYVISPEEIASCLKNANLEIEEGDVVLIRTGHGKLWMKDNATYGAGEPGIGLEAARFLTDRKVSIDRGRYLGD